MNPIKYDLNHIRRGIFSLSSHSDKSEKPIIGVSSNHDHVDENKLTDTYIRSIILSGGTPLIIPKMDDERAILDTVHKCDGIILSGGGDIHPLWIGEDPGGKSGRVDSEKDLFDFRIIYAALRYSIPILGICRGLQMLNVALGGTIYEDLPSQLAHTIGHDQSASRYETWHKVNLSKDGRLRNILGGEEEVEVNSFHHQAVRIIPDYASICATSSDGVIEAVDYYPEHNAIGVQWHPEALACNSVEPHTALFDFIVHEARLYRDATRLHIDKETIIADSHADTPTVYHKDPDRADFSKTREALIDYPRMVDGDVDIVTMACWIPQVSLSEESRRKAFELAREELTLTRTVIGKMRDRATILDDPEEAHAIVKNGKKGILLGIENGFAIGEDLDNLKLFRDLGVQYITLCHNGDNDICDSASKSQGTHGGLSDFGRSVVKEMNRLGMTIDVSHVGDKAIEEILTISSKPIISSHSSCRALYDHPRNLPDNLIRKIAQKGGVVQMCMYGGFLREHSEEATIDDLMEHIMHAYHLVGADHIGVGSDFDGDGEVSGVRHIGEMKRITIELLRRGVTRPEISMIMGGNYLRVLTRNSHHDHYRRDKEIITEQANQKTDTSSTSWSITFKR